MSTITLMRLYLRMQSMPRLPNIGNVGILYTTPLLDRQRVLLMEEATKCNGSPEFIGPSNAVMKKGTMGAYNRRHFYSTSASVEDVKKAEKARESKSKFKLMTAETVKIMLVSETGSLTAVTLIEANKIAKKKGLQLVHIQNDRDKPVKTEKEVYKLVSKVSVLEEEASPEDAVKLNERDKPTKIKDVKTALLKSNIGEHDAVAKINAMKKWVEKGHRVRVAISHSGDKGDAEKLFKTIEAGFAEVEAQVQQKVTKGNELRFYVAPPKKSSTTKSEAADVSKGKSKQSGSKSGDVNENKAHIS